MLSKAWSFLLWPVVAVPLSEVHLLLVRLRWFLLDYGFIAQRKFSIPVVVVGNVIAGGAGKTPLVLALLGYLKRQRITAGVVSRGYGRVRREVLEVQLDTPAHWSGDEPALIKQTAGIPVFVAHRRSDAVAALLLAYPATRVVICDDGLQHYGLARDIEIAVFDNRGIGNARLLPAGLLREPWPERLHRGIDLVLHTGNSPSFGGFTSQRYLATLARAQDGSSIPLASLKGQPLVALAGIANPQNFFVMLQASGLTLSKSLAFADHCDYLDVDFSLWSGHTLLCTEKDAVKLFGRADLKTLRLLAVPLEFLPEPAFFTAFDKLLHPMLSNSNRQTVNP